MDQDLNDDMNKLVRYSIICVDRENETVLQSTRDTLVKDRMDAGGFTAWKIAEFHDRLKSGEVDVPDEWRKDPPHGLKKTPGGKLDSLPGEVAKYLRVPFHIVDRYPRERFKYEEKQIQVLKEIKTEIGKGHIPLERLGPDEEMHIQRR